MNAICIQTICSFVILQLFKEATKHNFTSKTFHEVLILVQVCNTANSFIQRVWYGSKNYSPYLSRVNDSMSSIEKLRFCLPGFFIP